MKQVLFRPSWRRCLAIVLGMMVVGTSAQAAPVRLPADLNLISQSGANFASVRLGELADNELVKAFPPRMQKNMAEGLAEMKRGLGVEGTEVDRVSMLILEGNVMPAGLIYTKKPYDRDAVVKNVVRGEVAQQQHRGKTIYASSGRNSFFSTGFCPIDDRTYLIGIPSSIKKVLDAVAVGKEDPAMSEAIGLAAGNHHIVVGMQPKQALMLLGWTMHSSRASAPGPAVEEVAPPQAQPVPPALPPGLGEVPIAYFPPEEEGEQPQLPPLPSLDDILDELSPQILPFKPLFLAKTLTLAIDVGPATKLEFKLHYADEAAAKDGETTVKMLLYVLREILPWGYRETFDRPHTDSPDMAAFFIQVQTALRSAPVEVKGTDVVGSIALQIKPATLTALFAEIDKKSVYHESQNNLRQMGLAMHNFHDVNGRMPAAAICDPQGKPLLSWRVAILPYIEQEQLYKQFKLDEPWDSEHNKKLIAKMPTIYAAVQGEGKPGMTPYRVFAGNGAAFDLNVRGQQRGFTPGKGLTQITDGTSNTIMIVEAEQVTWTKPEPLPFDPNKPLPKLGGVFKDGFNALGCDGAVHFIKNGIDANTLRALITCDGGEVAGFPVQRERRRGFSGGATQRAIDLEPPPPPPGIPTAPVPEPKP